MNNKLKIGDEGYFQKTITEADIVLFAGISGDFNPVHVSKTEAEKTIFGERIAHGMLGASLISTAIGMYMPGPGTIYLEQNCKFMRPVMIGDTLTAKVQIKEIVNKEKGIVRLENKVFNQREEVVIVGESVVKVNSDRLVAD